MKCFICVSIPGDCERLHDNGLIKQLIKDLEDVGIKPTIADTLDGWGCLDQDWLEFECDIDTSYSWVKLLPFVGMEDKYIREGKDLNDYYWELFHFGKLLMMVWYIEKDEKGNKKYIPYR